MLALEDLIDLGETLHAQGFKSTPQQVMDAQWLLQVLKVQTALPAECGALVDYLAPIFCTQADQQSRFPQVYDTWLRTRFPKERLSAQQMPTLIASVEKPERHWTGWTWGIFLSVVVLAFILFAWDRYQPRVLTGIVKAEQVPVAGVQVQLGNSEVSSDAQGGFQLYYRKIDLPLRLVTTHPDFLSPEPLQIAGVPDEAVQVVLMLPQKRSSQLSLRTQILESVEVIHPPPTRFIKDRREEATFHPTHGILIAAPILSFILWSLWAQLRRRAFLQRIPARTPEVLKNLGAKDDLRKLASNTPLRRLVQDLRRRHWVLSRELNVTGTLSATLRARGYFTPVFGSRVEPEYLILVDRASLSDHLARLAQEVVRELECGDVLLNCYYYSGDPSVCAPADDRHRLLLDELQARYADRRLLIFSDGSGFIDGFRGGPARWVEHLLFWQYPVLLTPATPEKWGPRERELTRLGFTLLPLDRIGFATLAAVFSREPVAPIVEGTSMATRLPGYLRQAQYWVSRQPPNRQGIEELCFALARDLGERGFLWLCACAVYPEVHWGITMRLGMELVPERREFEALLPRLVRLPWFRQAYLPDWFRRALLARQSAENLVRIRSLLTELLHHVTDRPDAEIPLQIADLAAREKRRTLSGRIKSLLSPGPKDPDTNLIEDTVFLRFLAGKPDSLWAEATDAIRRLFYRQGLAALGPRTLLPFLVALIVASGMWRIFPVQSTTSFTVLRTVEQRHAPASTVAISDEGSVIAIGFTDGELLLKGAERGLVSIQLPKPVTALALKSTGSMLAIGSSDGTITVLDLGGLRSADQIQPDLASDAAEQSIGRHQGAIVALRFSVSGDRLLSADDRGDIRLWDVTARALVDAVFQASNPSTCVQIQTRGDVSAAVSKSGVVDLWLTSDPHHPKTYYSNLSTNDKLCSIADRRDPFSWISDANEDPTTGSLLVTASAAGRIEVLRDRQMIGSVEAVALYGAVAIAISEAKRLVVVTAESGATSVWRVLNHAIGQVRTGDIIIECAQCPKLVVLPRGRFMMGSSDSDGDAFWEESPRHAVRIDYDLAVGQTEVTFAQWDACVAESACDPLKDNGYGRGARPAINVSYPQARRYAQWLSQKTKKPYRLLSEAEWEYAARAGTTTKTYWGNDLRDVCAHANVYDHSAGGSKIGCDDGFAKTAPVASYRPNAFGLYDMIGNVSEWIGDCWKNTYEDAPDDGRAWSRGDCAQRVVRGGSWSSDDLRSLRSASRNVRYGYETTFENNILGFRVARTLP